MAVNSSGERRSKPKSRRTITSNRQKIPHQSFRRVAEQQDRQATPLSIYLVRLIVFGVALNAIIGTTISIINPPKQIATVVDPPLQSKPQPFDSLKLTQASLVLKNRLQTAIGKNSNLDPSYLFVEIDQGEYSELGADRVLAAASTIKLPIAIALFQDIDAGKVKLTEALTINQQAIAEGSGDLQELKPGTQVSLLVAATKMMTISDNTATNLIIDRLGGTAALNQRFRQWGLKVTTINHPLPDLQGTNTTTARELTRSMMALDRGKIVSDSARTQLLSIMSKTTRNTMLPPGLGAGAKIAHKTGDIGSLIADVGLIELPSGKSYIAAVLVKRPYNNPAGPALIREMSKITYNYFQSASPAPTSSPKLESKLSNQGNNSNSTP
jgi:beta-lactamase class A